MTKVLIVEDDEGMITTYKHVCENFMPKEYEIKYFLIKEKADFKKVIELFEEFRPDIVTLDGLLNIEKWDMLNWYMLYEKMKEINDNCRIILISNSTGFIKIAKREEIEAYYKAQLGRDEPEIDEILTMQK